MSVNVGVLNSTTGFGGLCLQFTRLVLGAPALYATAYKAYLGAQHKHPGDTNPPYGVPVFWAPKHPGEAGHVAVSLGGGLVRTTNSATRTIYTVAIKKITGEWGMPYLGWTEDLNGVRVWAPPIPPTPTPAPAPVPTVPEEDDMHDFIADLFRHGLGREGNPAEIARWNSYLAQLGITDRSAARMEFWKSGAEAGTVQVAFQEFLGRTSAPSDDTGFVNAYGTIIAVRDAVWRSVEARKRRGEIA